MTTILDDYSNRKVLDIIKYNSGIEFVRNFIILDKNATRGGFITFYITTSLFDFYISHQGIFTALTGMTSRGELVNSINDSTALLDVGMSARLLENYTINGTPYNEVIRMEADGTLDFREFTFLLIELAYNSEVEYSSQRVNPLSPVPNTFFVFMPFSDNQITFSENETSQLKYGRKIYRLSNLDLLSNDDNKQLVLDNKLAELKEPKARIIIDVPFDYNQFSILNEVTIKLSYRNIDQFRSFKEGGHFKSWTDAGDYRTKTFYIVGISHLANENKTRIKLLEKES